MVNAYKLRLILAVLALVILSCSMVGHLEQSATLYSKHSLWHDGMERSYLLIEPTDSLTEPAGLILALHGGGGTARSMCNMLGGLAEPARHAGFLLVCPQGYDRHWNDGRDIQTWQAHALGIDDVGFLTTLIEQLSGQYSIDPDAIFATGISNGGQMSYRLACERSETIRAFAPVVASMATTLDCEPQSSVSVMVINGTEDPLVPFEGGEIRALRRGLGNVRPTLDVFQFWAETNGCDQPAEVHSLTDRDPEDGTHIVRHKFSHCLEDERVVLYEVIGGGHTWPAANQYLPEFLIGRLSGEIEASKEILQFFQDLSD